VPLNQFDSSLAKLADLAKRQCKLLISKWDL